MAVEADADRQSEALAETFLGPAPREPEREGDRSRPRRFGVARHSLDGSSARALPAGVYRLAVSRQSVSLALARLGVR